MTTAWKVFETVRILLQIIQTSHTIMSLKVLVVDDERDVALLFRQRFRREMRNGEIELIFAIKLSNSLVRTHRRKATVAYVKNGLTGCFMSKWENWLAAE